MSTISEKSELLFLYESTFSIPNGDPFTGEQRYDDETKRILVSDVRIKRFIRDYLIERGHEIFVMNDKSTIEAGGESGAASRLNSLIKKYEKDLVPAESSPEPNEEGEESGKGKKAKGKKGSAVNALALLQKCTDVRLFGGISTKVDAAVNITGPVQFALLNPSLNAVDLRTHQNTSVFSSSSEKSRGAIGTTSVVPYALCQIQGWINPYSAKLSGMTEADTAELFAALWKSINNANTRSKSNQNAVLLLQIVYANADDKLYGLGRLLKLASDKRDEQLRSADDYKLDLAALLEKVASDKVKAVRYYTEVDVIDKALNGQPKFEKLQL
jgi:CRISPR-associated protein Csh2